MYMYLTLPLAHLHESLLVISQNMDFYVIQIYMSSKLSVFIKVGLGEMQMKGKLPKTQLT